MRLNKLPLALVGIFTLLLSACTLEDESAEKILETPIPPSVQAQKKNPLQEDFAKLALKCVQNETDHVEDLIARYNSTLPINDRTAPKYKNESLTLEKNSVLYNYQTMEITRIYENCLQKAASENKPQYLEELLTKNYAQARIARYFYIQKDYTNAAFWQGRVLNLAGLSTGYYILGRVFVLDENTLEIGANYLTEAAKLGNENAEHFLSDTVAFENVFDLIQKTEEAK